MCRVGTCCPRVAPKGSLKRMGNPRTTQTDMVRINFYVRSIITLRQPETFAKPFGFERCLNT